MKEHRLKTWPQFFEAIMNKEKTFELRRNDREYEVGDILILCEFNPCTLCGASGRVWDNGDMTDCDCTVTANPKGVYTGREMKFHLTYILAGTLLAEGVVAMGLRETKPKEFQVESLGKNARAMMAAGLRAMAGAIESGAEHVSGGGHLYMPKPEGETRSLLRLNMDLTVALPAVDQAPRIQLVN